MSDLILPPTTSVLVAVYEHWDFLRRTLLGLARQTRKDFEVVICDDGSGSPIRERVLAMQPELGFAIRYAWQEDKGFRKCKMLNEGIRQATTDYLVFLDADCIPHRRFVDEHLRQRRPGSFLVGRRVQLGPAMSQALDDDDVRDGRLERLAWTGPWHALRRRLRQASSGMWLPMWLTDLRTSPEVGLKGCNFSCWKADLVAINGFDEGFVTPGGGEDGDIRRRFRLHGLTARNVKHVARVYHQYHPIVPRDPAGLAQYDRLVESGKVLCEQGLEDRR